MIQIENIEVWGFEHAIRGMRNPLNSWNRSDSHWEEDVCDPDFVLGDNDLDLMQRLTTAGEPHRKFARQIFVSFDINAPLYWWKEFDTYKVGTTSNSCSTMHKIHSKEFTLDDFSVEHLSEGEYGNIELMKAIIDCLNVAREWFIQTKDKDFWWQMIQLLPSSYNQRRTITCNYENILNMLGYRVGHKLDEWNIFCDTMISELPYMQMLWTADLKRKGFHLGKES